MYPENEVTIFEGSYHWNFFITFDDGVKWVVRMAQIDHTLPPLPALRMTAASEYATLKALSEAGIKVPRVWPSKALTCYKTMRAMHSVSLQFCIYVSSLLEACAHPQPRGLIVLRRILPKEVILQS